MPDPPAEEPIVQAERAQDAPPPAEITARRFAEPDEEPVRRASAVSEAREGSDGPQLTPEQYRSYVDYVRSVRQRFVREARYPRNAERAGIEGVGVLRIRANRNGRIESWSIRQSAGDPQLDAELERCARRVRRVDRIPENIPADTLDFDIPIRFTIVN
ncbi:MAG: TonB family protein [Pseudomonadota bacterium]